MHYKTVKNNKMYNIDLSVKLQLKTKCLKKCSLYCKIFIKEYVNNYLSIILFSKLDYMWIKLMDQPKTISKQKNLSGLL